MGSPKAMKLFLSKDYLPRLYSWAIESIPELSSKFDIIIVWILKSLVFLKACSFVIELHVCVFFEFDFFVY